MDANELNEITEPFGLGPATERLIMKLCECPEADKPVVMIGMIDHFPLNGGRHTAFVMMQCAKCGKFEGFPSYNFKLALADGEPGALEKLNLLYSGND